MDGLSPQPCCQLIVQGTDVDHKTSLIPWPEVWPTSLQKEILGRNSDSYFWPSFLRPQTHFVSQNSTMFGDCHAIIGVLIGMLSVLHLFHLELMPSIA